MHTIWSGSIGFGLVNIPVKLYTATQESSLDLDMLDKSDHANIRYARINSNTGKEVAWGDIVKGYKYNDEYVVLTDEDFEKVSPKKSKIIEIQEFVNEADIDTTYFDTPYYLEPSNGGEKAYVLLREALKKSGKVGIGDYVLRNKENLCILRPQRDVILLQKIRFAEEIRDTKDLNIPGDITVKPAELKMAEALIDQLTSKKTDLSVYKDKYDDELMAIIEAKAKGKKITTKRIKLEPSNTKDLMAQLKASLATPATRTRKKAS